MFCKKTRVIFLSFSTKTEDAMKCLNFFVFVLNTFIVGCFIIFKQITTSINSEKLIILFSEIYLLFLSCVKQPRNFIKDKTSLYFVVKFYKKTQVQYNFTYYVKYSTFLISSYTYQRM